MNLNRPAPPYLKRGARSRFRLELTRHNQRVIITNAKDKGRYVNYIISYYINVPERAVPESDLNGG